jgi:hypothetical protein
VYLIEISDVDVWQTKIILGFIKKIVAEKQVKELVTRVNHDESFIKILMTYGRKMVKPYAWQIKVVDYLRLFKKIKNYF